MDRLHSIVVIAAVALVASACSESESKNATSSGRVNAAESNKAAPKPVTETPKQFCDVHRTGADAPEFSLPPLDSPPPAPSKTWRWVNVWATWCKPCVEEIPLLLGWQKQLQKRGGDIELVLVSVDDSRETIDAFRKKHGAIPDTLRTEDPEAVGPWLAGLGLDEGAPLPVHIFVAPSGKIRCLRAAAVDDNDFAAVAGLID